MARKEKDTPAFRDEHDAMLWNFYRLPLRYTMKQMGNPVILLVPKEEEETEKCDS